MIFFFQERKGDILAIDTSTSRYYPKLRTWISLPTIFPAFLHAAHANSPCFL